MILRFWVAYLTSLHQLHNQEEVLIIFVNVVKLDNVGMVDLLKNVDFILQADFVFLGKFAPNEKKRQGTSSQNEQISWDESRTRLKTWNLHNN